MVQQYLAPRVQSTLEPNNVIRHFKAALKRAGLPETTQFHDLRHWCASLLISYNVHPKAIQEILGHANITTTLHVYGHLLPNLLRDATDQIAGLAGERDAIAEQGSQSAWAKRATVALHAQSELPNDCQIGDRGVLGEQQCLIEDDRQSAVALEGDEAHPLGARSLPTSRHRYYPAPLRF